MKNLTLIDKAFFLKKTPMFSSLELDLLLPIADKLIIIDFEANEVVFDLGEQAFNMYIIGEGKVSIRDASKQEIALLEIGEVFGDESIFSGLPREYQAICKVPTYLLTLTQADLLAIIHEYPKVATGFIEMFTRVTPFRSRKPR